MKNEHQFQRLTRTAPRAHFMGGGEPTYRHPSDWHWTDTALVVAIIVAIGCMAAGITVWNVM